MNRDDVFQAFDLLVCRPLRCGDLGAHFALIHRIMPEGNQRGQVAAALRGPPMWTMSDSEGWFFVAVVLSLMLLAL